MRYGPCDLVRYAGQDFTVLRHIDNILVLIAQDWPLNFAEIDSYEGPHSFDASDKEVELIESGHDRLLKLVRRIDEAGDQAEASGGWDWTTVDQLLADSAAVFPRHLMRAEAPYGTWRLDHNVPEFLIPLAQPVGRLLASHAENYGEADVGDLSDAYARAKTALEVYPALPRP